MAKEHKKRERKRLLQKRRGELNAKNFPSEVWFLKMLKKRGYDRFLRNYPLLKTFYGDFVWRRAKVVVEIDGSSHDGKEGYDAWRDRLLSKNGYTVYRIRMNDTDKAMEVLNILEKTEHICREKKKKNPPAYGKEYAEKKEARRKRRAVRRELFKKKQKEFNQFCKEAQAKDLAKKWLTMNRGKENEAISKN